MHVVAEMVEKAMAAHEAAVSDEEVPELGPTVDIATRLDFA